MPAVLLTIKSTHKTVVRPVIQSVATDLMANFGLGTSFTLHYSGTDDPEDLVVTDSRNTRHGTGFFENTKVLLTSDIEYVENSRSATVHGLTENKPVFLDNDLGLLVSPNYARSKVILSFQIRCNDKTSAYALKSRIRQLFQIDHKCLYHDVKYMYLIPNILNDLLTEIHTLRETQGAYGEDLGKYYKDHFISDVGSVSNKTGSFTQLSVREHQNRILGNYDFIIAPEKPEVTDSKRYVLNFNYEFEFDEPISFNVKYPLIVHNQLISSKYFDNTIPYELAMIDSKPSQTLNALDFYTRNNELTQPHKGLPIPTINDWAPVGHQGSLIGIARLIVICDEDKPYETINLLDLGDVELNTPTIDFIKDNKERVLSYRRAPIYISLYEDGIRIPDSDIYMTDDLTIMTKFRMSVRSRYNMWISAYEDLFIMNPSDIDRLRYHVEFTENILLAQAPELARANSKYKLPGVRADGVMLKDELLKVLEMLYSKKIPHRSDVDFSRRNLGFYLITAKGNKEDG